MAKNIRKEGPSLTFTQIRFLQQLQQLVGAGTLEWKSNVCRAILTCKTLSSFSDLVEIVLSISSHKLFAFILPSNNCTGGVQEECSLSVVHGLAKYSLELHYLLRPVLHAGVGGN